MSSSRRKVLQAVPLAAGTAVLSRAAQDDPLLAAFTKRQTVRRYKPDPVPEDHVRQILEAARRAPTCMNQQPWKFLVIRKPETIERMKKATLALLAQRFESAAAKQPGMSPAEIDARKKKSLEFTSGYFSAPVYVVVLVDSESACSAYAQRHDGPIAAGYLMVAARAFGYGTAYLTDGIPDQVTKDVLKIPERYKRVCITPIGVPDGWPKQQQKRKLEEMVAYETLEGHPPLEKLPYNP